MPAAVAGVEHDRDTWLRSVCRRAGFALLRASASERAALRRAVDPVYRMLERDPLTRELIGRIRRLRAKRGTRVDELRCGPRSSLASSTGATRMLEGRWRATLTREALRGSGASPGLTEALRGTWTLAFEGDRFVFRREEGGGGRGTYTVDGSSIRFVWERGIEVRLGEVFFSRWSMYRDQLSFSPVPGRTKLVGLDVAPFERVG